MSEPPRKSRRLASKPSKKTSTKSVTHNINENPDNCTLQNTIQKEIRKTIPEITNAVVAALRNQGLVFPTIPSVPTQTPMMNDDVQYPAIAIDNNSREGTSTSTQHISSNTPQTTLSVLNRDTCNTTAGSIYVNDPCSLQVSSDINTHGNTTSLTCDANIDSNDRSVNFTSINKPLALGVDPKIKAKIWAHEYIDLGCLVSKKSLKPRFQPVESVDGNMMWEKQQVPNFRFESIAHWLTAFHVFVGIYTERYPHETGALMKYANTIQTLARRSCEVAAFIYDRTFREWREHDFRYLPWDQVNNELYSDAMALGLKIKFDQLKNQSLKKSPFLQTGAPEESSRKYCFSYNNKYGSCTRGSTCKYPHICGKCGGDHPRKFCRPLQHRLLPQTTVQPSSNPKGGNKIVSPK